MDKFKFKGGVEILHLNTRKEGPEEDKVLAVDVKMSAVMGRSVLDFFEPMLGSILFLDSGAVRNPMMGPIQFLNQLEHYRLETFGSSFVGVTVKKFVIEPKDINQIILTFAVSFKPSGVEVARLAEYLQDVVQIRLEPDNEELDLSGAAAVAKKLDDLCRKDGVTMAVSGNDGKVIAEFGGSAGTTGCAAKPTE
jgi:hypothetical protein